MLRCTLDGVADGLIKAAARHTTVSITSEEPDLEDYFFHRYAADAVAGAGQDEARTRPGR